MKPGIRPVMRVTPLPPMPRLMNALETTPSGGAASGATSVPAGSRPPAGVPTSLTRTV